MNKISFFAAFLFASAFACAQNPKVINDRNAETRNANGFHAINISHGIDLYLSQGDEAVAVSASDIDTRNRIKVEVENGVLHIYLENKGMHWDWGNKKMKAYVSFKMLDDLEASGGSDVFTEGTIKQNKLSIHLSGGSDLKAKVEINDLSLHQSGGSDVSISGTVSNLKIDASGGSDFNGYDLASDVCDIEASGGSDTHITVNKELSVSASGGSDVYYKGSGVIKNMHSSGSSSISKKG
jgi:putative autotransporter adhesin-like protein